MTYSPSCQNGVRTLSARFHFLLLVFSVKVMRHKGWKKSVEKAWPQALGGALNSALLLRFVLGPTHHSLKKRCARLDRGRLFAAAGLDFDVDVHEGHGRRRDTGNAGGLANGPGADLRELFLHFAGEAAD